MHLSGYVSLRCPAPAPVPRPQKYRLLGADSRTGLKDTTILDLTDAGEALSLWSGAEDH